MVLRRGVVNAQLGRLRSYLVLEEDSSPHLPSARLNRQACPDGTPKRHGRARISYLGKPDCSGN